MVDDPLDAYRLLIADVYELAGLSRRTSESIAAELGQTAARWHVMSVVTDGRRTVPEIADRLGLARQSVQRVVDELEDDSLVRFVDNPGHRRSRHVELTARGRRVADHLFERSAAARRSQLDAAGVSSEELARARRTIVRLVDAIR
jgi:DNA-binding MarR family transcriptional regulator